MSFDIFLQFYRNGEPATFKRSVFDEIFETETDQNDPDFVQPEYPDGSGGDIYVGENDIQCIMFNHCGGDIFWAKVYELLYVTQSLVFWPAGGPAAVVGRADALKHLPSGFDEMFGKIHVVANARELEALIYG